METNKELLEYIDRFISKTKDGAEDSDGHVLPLFALALAKRGKTYVELGVRNGITTLPFLLAAHLNGGILFSVDVQETQFICPSELQPNWRFIKSDAIQFLKDWDRSNKIDLIFIDDWHAYPHVKKELSLIENLVTPSDIILLHDLMYGMTEPRYHTNPAMHKGEWAYGGPYRAVSELDRNKWEWATMPWFSGLTLLRKKAPLFQENRIKIWAKRILKSVTPQWERKFVNLHQKIKK